MRWTWPALEPIRPPRRPFPTGWRCGVTDSAMLSHIWTLRRRRRTETGCASCGPSSSAAQEAGDGERAARLEAEIDIIVGELSAAFGLGGRARKEGSSAERARQSVTKAIRDALRRIREEDPALGEHLTRAVRTGIYCTYDPDPAGAPPTWRTDRRV